MSAQPSTQVSTSQRRRSPIDAAWGALTSVRLALVLILLLALAATAGAGIAQAPPPALESPDQFSLWMEQVRPKYGPLTDVFARLQLFNVFTSNWFRLLVTLLAINILVCTISRCPRLWQRARRRASPVVGDHLFDRAPLRAESQVPGLPVETAAARVRQILERDRYAVSTIVNDDGHHLLAEKHRYGPLGTLVSHAGLISVLLGAVWGGWGGFVESQFVVAEGEERAIGHDTGLSIFVESFVDEYYAGLQGVPKDYRSSIVMLREGEPVASGTVRVNEPLIHDGIRVHQAFYGPAAVMRVRDGDGAVLLDSAVALRWITQERPAGSFLLPEFGLEVFIISSASAFIDEVVPPGELRLEVYDIGGNSPRALENIQQGVARDVGGLEFTFVRESRFTGLQIVKDPALPIVWLGCAMVVLGSVAVLYFPHRRLWVRVNQGRGSSGVRVRLATTRERGLPFESDFKRLARKVGAIKPTGRQD